MTQSIIGPNAALRYLKAYNAHVGYWHDVNPAYLLAYVDKKDHVPYIQEYAAEFPDSMVVARIQHDLDGGFHLKPTGPNDTRHYVASPENYYKDYGFLGSIKNVILNVLNEPNGYDDDVNINRLVSWLLEYIPLAVAGKSKTVLINWGDRQPRIIGGMMDGRFGGILKLAALYPELFYIGMHFYGPDDITEHLESYIKLCKELEIKPLRVIGTEFGFDKTNGNQSGYKSRGIGGGAYAAWQISQVQHDLAPYIKSGVLVGLNVFQEGNSGGWDSFDIENDKAYKDELKRAALAGEIQPMTPPKPAPTVPAPAYLGIPKTITVSGGSNWNLRTEPDIVKGEVVGMVRVGEVINLYSASIQPNGGNNFYYVERATPTTGESASGWLAYVLPSTAPLPAPANPLPPSAPYPEVSAKYAREMAAVYKSLGNTYGLMQTDSYKTSEQWAKLADVIDNKLDNAA